MKQTFQLMLCQNVLTVSMCKKLHPSPFSLSYTQTISSIISCNLGKFPFRGCASPIPRPFAAGKNTLTTILQAVKSETIDVMADLQGLGKNQTSSGTIKGGPKGLFKI